MKVLFLTKSSPVYGGVERWLDDLHSGLAKRGHEVTVALAQGRNFHDPERYHAAYPDLNVVKLDGRTGTQVGREMAVRKCLKQVDPDIVIPVMLADGLRISAEEKTRFKYKIIYPVHEISQGVHEDLRKYGASMDKIVFVDRSGLKKYASEHTTDGQVSLIRCGVPPAIGVQNPTGREEIRIGFCGRLEQTQKRVMDLVDLCSNLDSMDIKYSLDIVGEGAAKSALAEGLGKLCNNSSIRFWDTHDRAYLYRYFYPSIDALIVTSNWETGPLVAFEALMHGVTLVTSDFYGRVENGLLRDGENCLVFPVGDMESASRRICFLTHNPQFITELKESARQECNRSCSLETMCAEWSVLLEEATVTETRHPIKVDVSALGWPNLSKNANVIELARRLTGRHFSHTSVRAEWPFYN